MTPGCRLQATAATRAMTSGARNDLRTARTAATASGIATVWQTRTKLPPSGLGTTNSVIAVSVARIAPERTIRLLVAAASRHRVATDAAKWKPRNGNRPGSPNSNATVNSGAVVANAIAVASRRRVASATAAAAIARNTPATGLASGVIKAAASAIPKRPRRHARTAASATASPSANGARPTITLTTIAIAKTWSAIVAEGVSSRERRMKQYVATSELSATTQNGPNHAISGGATTLYVGVA